MKGIIFIPEILPILGPGPLARRDDIHLPKMFTNKIHTGGQWVLPLYIGSQTCPLRSFRYFQTCKIKNSSRNVYVQGHVLNISVMRVSWIINNQRHTQG